MSTFFGGVTFLAILGLFGGLVKFYYEFARDNARRRSDLYDKLREKFDSDEFGNIYEAIDRYTYCLPEEKGEVEKAIRALPLHVRDKFAAFIEYVGLLTKSELLSCELSNDEFGYYAILCWECTPLWDDITDPVLKQNDPYWALYREFVEKLRPVATALKGNPSAEIAKLKL